MTPEQTELILAALSRLTSEVSRIADSLSSQTAAAPRKENSSSSGEVSAKQLKYIRDLRRMTGDTSTEIPETSSEASDLIKELQKRPPKKKEKTKESASPRRPEPEPEPEPDKKQYLSQEEISSRINEFIEKKTWN